MSASMKTKVRRPSRAALALLARAQDYCRKSGRKLSTVSIYLFNDGKTLIGIRDEGRDVYSRAIEAANDKLDKLVKELAEQKAKGG